MAHPARLHQYRTGVTWTGNTGSGTASYTAYLRDYLIAAEGKPAIPGSSDPVFRGDPARWSPEELFLASLSACHQLWYLHLCADAGITVTAYRDEAEGTMLDDPGRFTGVRLKPQVTISAGDAATALALHQEAHARCFLANSVNFPVEVIADIRWES